MTGAARFKTDLVFAIVDDVVTTVTKRARVLLQHGAIELQVWALVRAVI